MSLAAMLAAM
jgi:hypothetical protein